MKRLLAVLFLVIPLAAFSQSILKFNTTSYAFAHINFEGYYNWNKYEKCTIKIVIDPAKDMITIYNKITQYYYIYDSYNDGNPYYDNEGGIQIKFYIIDRDGDKGSLRLRIDRHGNSQIYIDFKDCAWCYNVYKIN